MNPKDFILLIHTKQFSSAIEYWKSVELSKKNTMQYFDFTYTPTMQGIESPTNGNKLTFQVKTNKVHY